MYDTNNWNSNYRSYGSKVGNFKLSATRVSKSTVEEFENYALVEVKTPYYKLMFDIDIKKNKEYYEEINEDIVMSIMIQEIEHVLTEYMDANMNYIYCDKNIDKGVHLYYPEIIVDNNLHNAILRDMKYRCVLNSDIPEHIWEDMIDKSVTNANGLRLPYFQKNGNYYRVNHAKSTYLVKKRIRDEITACMIRTSMDNYNFELKKEIAKENKCKKKIIKNDGYVDTLELDECDLFIDLLNNIRRDRLDNYEEWIKVVYLCRTYGFYDIAINISKLSTKFDENSESMINAIFNKEQIP